jgi:hypothetical protein
MIISMEALSIVFWLGSLLATIFRCIPLEAIWNWSISDSWCIDIATFYHANASIMIGMDLVLYLMPIIFLEPTLVSLAEDWLECLIRSRCHVSQSKRGTNTLPRSPELA